MRKPSSLPARLLAAALLTLALGACAGTGGRRVTDAMRERWSEQAAESVVALQEARFEAAEQHAATALQADADNPQANAIAGLLLYQRTVRQLISDVFTVAMGFLSGGFNHRYMRFALEESGRALARVDELYARATIDPEFRLPLCMACWEHDWNRNGRIDSRDRRLFEVEYDENGDVIPEGDPRRRPTFQFDVGDLHWVRAMVTFQRAALEVLLAYKWTEIDRLWQRVQRDGLPETEIAIRIDDPERVRGARDLIVAGLAHANAARQSYLAETDDAGEWVPNPEQKSHPLPYPVDQTLYDTWEGVLRDLTWLLEGREGLSVEDLAQLGDHQWPDPPRGFLHIGRLFDEPGDIVLNGPSLEELEDDRSRENVERVLTEIFGDKYVPEMKRSPLVDRLKRMKNEVQRGEESFERKLRYLLWLN